MAEEIAYHRELMPEQSRPGSNWRAIETTREVWGWGWLDRLTQDLTVCQPATLALAGLHVDGNAGARAGNRRTHHGVSPSSRRVACDDCSGPSDAGELDAARSRHAEHRDVLFRIDFLCGACTIVP